MFRFLMVLQAGLLMTACAVGVHGAAGQYALGTDTVTNACLKNPANCPPAVGQPTAAGSIGASSSLVGVAAIGGLVVQSGWEMDEELTAAIDKALAECADDARSEMILKYFKSRWPTREDCNEVVGMNRRGEPITRAMQLGVEQHELALQCAEEKLSKLKPGGFILSPRYRYNPTTEQTQYIPPEVVKELVAQGRSEELKGTIEPDLVIHEGDACRVQAVYDFKFPCVNTDREVPWRHYPEGITLKGIRLKGWIREKYMKKLWGESPREFSHG
jgi:hypothetical protein